jgi:hypothetical protein
MEVMTGRNSTDSTHDTRHTMQEAETDFNKVSTDDYPGKKPHETFTVTKDTKDGELDVEIEFRGGRINVTASGAYSFSTTAHTTANSSVVEGKTALECGRVYLSGERTNLEIGIPDGIHERLEELQDAHEEWEEEAEDWLTRQPLRFRVGAHEYKTETWRTKYQQSAVVLKPNKKERDMTRLEEKLYEAMRDEFGAADGYPVAPDEFEEGNVVRREEVAVGDVAERWREIEEEREEQERWEELVAEYPALRGTSASSEEVEKAFREANRDEERKEITGKSTGCSEPSYECNLDNVVLYATPDREIETDRIHTH